MILKKSNTLKLHINIILPILEYAHSFLGFRQIEESHIMENVIFNELKRRGYNVDVGVVEVREKDSRKRVEIDFAVNKGYDR